MILYGYKSYKSLQDNDFIIITSGDGISYRLFFIKYEYNMYCIRSQNSTPISLHNILKSNNKIIALKLFFLLMGYNKVIKNHWDFYHKFCKFRHIVPSFFDEVNI